MLFKKEKKKKKINSNKLFTRSVVRVTSVFRNRLSTIATRVGVGTTTNGTISKVISIDGRVGNGILTISITPRASRLVRTITVVVKSGVLRSISVVTEGSGVFVDGVVVGLL